MVLPTLLEIDVRQAAQFLRRGYELERAGQRLVSAFEVGRQLGFREETSRDLCAYLVEKGFINQVGSGCGFRLSNRGLDEIEWGFASPGFLHDLLCEKAEMR